MKYLVRPTTQATCAVIILDTETLAIAFLHEIKLTCCQWLTKTSCSQKDLQSILGKLLYDTKCVCASRPSVLWMGKRNNSVKLTWLYLLILLHIKTC